MEEKPVERDVRKSEVEARTAAMLHSVQGTRPLAAHATRPTAAGLHVAEGVVCPVLGRRRSATLLPRDPSMQPSRLEIEAFQHLLLVF